MELSVDVAVQVILPLVGFAIGIAVYSMFIFRIYKFVGRRDIFRLHLRQYNTAGHAGLRIWFDRLLYTAEYLFVLPVIVFFWFIIFAVLLLLLSEQPAELVVLISVAIIAAVRICSYYSEELANDIAKTIPLALLGVFLLDINAYDLAEVMTVWPSAVGMFDVLVYYLIFLIILEWFLRLFTAIVDSFERPQI
jgi:hypothetical protein